MEKATFILGVCGGSASGKSYAVAKIINALLPVSVSVIDQDSFYKDLSHLPEAERGLVNFDHPDSVDIHGMQKCLTSLKSGVVAFKPVYDFVSHTRTSEFVKVDPTKVVIIEGLHILYHKNIRDLMDYSVFIDVDNDIRFIRRLTRDIQERGRCVESVISQYLETVRPMDLQYVQPNKVDADVIVTQDGLEVEIDRLVCMLRSLCI